MKEAGYGWEGGMNFADLCDCQAASRGIDAYPAGKTKEVNIYFIDMYKLMVYRVPEGKREGR